MGGYFVGSETYILPLDYLAGSEEPVDWTWAFERDNWMALRPVETSIRRMPDSWRSLNSLNHELADIKT